MTRERAADAFDEIARRQREIAAEHDKAIAGEAACDCPTAGLDSLGVAIKVHQAGCLLSGP